MSEITQEQVDVKALEIYKKITNHAEFVMSNYTILNKKPYLTGDEGLLIKQSRNNYRYQSPERIIYYAKIVAFYLALDELQVPYEEW
jgi:hypothetical protein